MVVVESIELLAEKFDFVSKDIRNSVEVIDYVAVLDELIKKIIKVDIIEAFERLLEKAQK